MASAPDEVDCSILRQDDVAAVECLERMAEEGTLTRHDRIVLALLLMMPPFPDYEAAIAQLAEVCELAGPLRTEAAVWGVYMYITLQPVEDRFTHWLEQDTPSAEACYLLARAANYHGQQSAAREWVERAVSIRPFPNALLLAAQLTPSTAERETLVNAAEKLVKVRDFERCPGPGNRQELRQRYWSELILGERLTSVVWQHTYRERTR